MGQTLNRLANRPANKQRSQPQEITMRRTHFRGALLGLTLAPTAVSLTLTGRSASTTIEDTHISADIENALQKRIESCLAQVHHFLSNPLIPLESVPLGSVPLRSGPLDSLPLESTSAQASQRKTWLDALPILLRYCDHPTSHSLWKADAATTAQYWILSDILAQAMSHQPLNKTWLRRQAQQATQTKDTSPAACHYRWLWNTLIEKLLSPLPSPLATSEAGHKQASTASAASHLTAEAPPKPHDTSHHCAVVTGIVCALSFISNGPATVNSASYGLAVTMATPSISASSPHWEAPIIAGLVSGAIAGHSNLPVLWQQTALGLSLADDLFYEWAGSMVEHP